MEQYSPMVKLELVKHIQFKVPWSLWKDLEIKWPFKMVHLISKATEELCKDHTSIFFKILKHKRSWPRKSLMDLSFLSLSSAAILKFTMNKLWIYWSHPQLTYKLERISRKESTSRVYKKKLLITTRTWFSWFKKDLKIDMLEPLRWIEKAQDLTLC